MKKQVTKRRLSPNRRRRSALMPVERLEDRTVLAAAFALSGSNLISFDTATPTQVTSTAISGVGVNETLVGIDVRPQNGVLYGLGVDAAANTATLYAVSTRTGQAGVVGTAGQIAFTTDGTTVVDLPDPATVGYGVDFNPVVDRFRVVAGSLNFRVNPNTGAAVDGNNGGGATTGTNPDGAINDGTTSVDATAYTNNQPNATATTQYTLDAASNMLFLQNPPNAGTQTEGSTVTLDGDPLDFSAVNGFDIPSGVNVDASNDPVSGGSGFAALTVDGVTSLYSIVLGVGPSAGVVTAVGAIGTGEDAISGLSIRNDLGGIPTIGLGAAGETLVRFNTATIDTSTTVALGALTEGETLVAIDFRPQTGQLYGLGVDATANTATLYLIDPQLGTVTAVGTASQIAFVDAGGDTVDLPSAASGYGLDFNPTVDRIRVTTSTGLNFRINPDTGAPVDGNLGGAAGSVAGTNTDGAINGLDSTGVSATAYTNSFGQSLTGGVTTQYTLDASSDSLFIQNPPNSGTQTTPVAITLDGNPLDFDNVNGFDIPAAVRVTTSNTVASGFGIAILTVGGESGIVKIDLASGEATFIGQPTTALSALAIGDATNQLDLVVNAPAANDTIAVSVNGANLEVRINNVLVSSTPLSDVESLTINGSDGDDTITVSGLTLTSGGGLTINGGGGTNTATLSNVNVSNSAGDGLIANSFTSFSVSNSTFNNNTGDGIDLTAAGAVTFVGVTATGNDPGVLVNGAASFSDTDGNFSLNDDHGIQLIDIVGAVTLIRTVADSNDADDDDVGDGLNATDSGADVDDNAIGSLLVQGARFRLVDDGAGGAEHQERGVFVSQIAGSATFENSGGTTVEVTDNEDDGVVIENGVNVTFTNGTYSDNGNDGIDISTASIVTLTGVTADSNGNDGVELGDSGAIASVVISGGTYDGNGTDGIDVANVSGTVSVTGASASGNGDDGLEIDDVVVSVTLTDVTADDNNGDGADIDSSGNITISGGSYDNNDEDGIELDDVGIVSITNTSASGNDGDGINIDTAGAVTIGNADADVTTNSNGSDGIEIDNVTSVTLARIQSSSNVNGDGVNIDNTNGGVVTLNVGIAVLSNLNGNDDDGIETNATDAVTINNTNANSNDGDGLHISNASGLVTVSLTEADSNGDEGMDFNTIAGLDIDNSEANSNDNTGLEAENITGNVTIDVSSFNDNGQANATGDGLEIDNVTGSVTFVSVTASGNDPGVSVDGAASFSDTDGIYNQNDDGGLVLANITGAVSLTNTTATENDADEDNVGDGLNIAATVVGPITILGGTYSDPDADDDDQQNGIVINGDGTQTVTIGSSASPVTASGNTDRGIDIDSVATASLGFVTASDNGTFGFEISTATTVNLNDLTLLANNGGAGDGNSGGRLDTIGTVNYTTDTDPGTDDDVLFLSQGQIDHDGATPAGPDGSQPIDYVTVTDMNIFTTGGNDTINITGTGASGTTTVDGDAGNDTITINGDGLSANNVILGDLGNDEIILNITAHIGDAPLFAIESLRIEGNDPGDDSENRDRLTINDTSSFIRDLNYDYLDTAGDLDILNQTSGFGLFGPNGGGELDLQVRTMETLIFNDDGGNNDLVRVTGTSVDDVLTVALRPNDTSAQVFLNGNPYLAAPPDTLAGNRPGLAGGAGLGVTGPDMLINGINAGVGIRLNGGGDTSATSEGSRAVVQGASESDILSGGTLDIFGFGAGVLIPGFTANNAYDTFTVTDTQVTTTNNTFGALLTVNLDTDSFVQLPPAANTEPRSALIVNGGDEATVQAGLATADIFNVTVSDNFYITLNGNLPVLALGVNGLPIGDELNVASPGSVNIYSDKATPPNVATTFGNSAFGVRYTSMERVLFAPGNGVVNLIGDNNDANIDQNDNFVVVGRDVDDNGEGVNEFTLQINGSSPILLNAVSTLNVYGYDLQDQTDLNNPAVNPVDGGAGIDTLDIRAYADDTPRGWGIDVHFNEGGPAGSDGAQADLLIYRTSLFGGEVSENIVITPSGAEAGELVVTNAGFGTPVVDIDFLNNLDIIIVDDDGFLNDADTLTLRGTNLGGPGASGNDTVTADFTAAGDVANPLVTVADGGTLLYRVRNITDDGVGSGIVAVNIDLLSGNDTLTLNSGTRTINVTAGDGNDTLNASTSTNSVTLNGGNGNDSLTGGSGADVLLGGVGNDTIIGGAGVDQENGDEGNDRFGDGSLTGNGVADDAGADVIFGGDGIDQFIWEAGDGSDVVQGGDDGADILRFFGSDATADAFTLSANAGAPTHFNIVLGGATVDTHGVEQINVTGRTGDDSFTIGDLTTTEVASVLVDATAGDTDTVVINGRNTGDDLAVSVAAGVISVQGLSYDVNLINVATADTLTINGNDGHDTLKANAGVEATIGIVLNGNAGDDNLSADATINGGDGNDTIEGGSGSDSLTGGNGDDTFLFNAGGTDSLDGGDGFDVYFITTAGGDDTITFSQAAATVNGGTETLVLTSVDRFVVSTGGGVDTITATMTSIGAIVDAGAGNDVVNGSASTTALTIDGGDGNDSLTGGGGDDLISGGVGNDTIIGGAGVDQEYGDEGNDRFGDGSTTGNGVADDAGADVIFGGDGIDQFIWEAGDGSDVVQGGDDGADILRFFGSDATADAFTLSANAGAPTHFNIVLGGATVDTHGVEQINVTGRTGGDTFTIGDLTTTEIASVLVDATAGDADAVVIDGRNTDDDLAVSVAAGVVSVQGLSYDVNVINVTTADTLTVNGNNGDDTLKANVGVETTIGIVLNGNAGDDNLSADATLNGGDGNDLLKGGTGNNSLSGGAGDDTLTGGAGTDVLDGGDDQDVLQETRNVNFNLTGTLLTAGADAAETLVGIEFVELTGGAGANTLTVGAVTTFESVTLNGLAGNDIFNVTPSVNVPITVNGGSPVTPATPGDTLNLELTGVTNPELHCTAPGDGFYTFNNRQNVTFTSIETLPALPLVPGFVGLVDDCENPGFKMLLVVGTVGNDNLTFQPRLHGQQIIVKLNKVNVGTFQQELVGRIVAHGLTGNDRIVLDNGLGKTTELHGDAGNDTIYGGAGRDEIFGGTENDFIYGRSGLDRLSGEGGNDRLYGQAGHDILLGGSGDDLLYGGRDRDVLIGGTGIDKLYGESGDDILIGGTTSHDANETALLAILAEWTTGNDYATRVANIRAGGGQSDGFALNAANAGTVLDDGVIDDLFGGGNQDWLFNPGEVGGVTGGISDRLRDRKISTNPATNELVN